ncbi:MAG: hypothetical protein AAF561_09285, partial [Planctomycetota bacterium]
MSTAAESAVRPVWHFDATQDWIVDHDRHKSEPSYSRTLVDNGLRIELGPADESVSLQVWARKLGEFERLDDLRSFEVEIDLLEGETGSVLITFKDEEGERFTFATRKLSGGKNTVRWEAPRDFHRQEPAPVGGLKLFNMRVQRQASNSATVFVLREARAAMFQPIDEMIGIDVETGDPLHFLEPGDTRGIWVRLQNHTSNDISATVTTAVTNRFRDVPEFGIGQPVDIAAGGSVDVDFGPESAATPGVFYAHWRVELDDGRHATGMSSYAVLDPVGPTPGIEPDHFVFGTAGFHREWSSPPERVKLISRSAGLVGVE